MRMSCNGCRVLRRACSDNCTIKPCLEWIKSPDSQAHATLFLAKFYGRAGLLNLLNSCPDTQRPAIFRSLLYEACGRIVDPVYGSVGLLHTGRWQQCLSAVEAVLRGGPIFPFKSEAAAVSSRTLYDVRLVPKDGMLSPPGFGNEKKARARSKRAGIKAKGSLVESERLELTRSNSHQSSLSHQSDSTDDATGLDGESKSVAAVIGADDIEDGLELTLAVRPIKKGRYDGNGGDCNMALGTSILGCSS